jgi:hypothetical protein
VGFGLHCEGRVEGEGESEREGTGREHILEGSNFFFKVERLKLERLGGFLFIYLFLFYFIS